MVKRELLMRDGKSVRKEWTLQFAILWKDKDNFTVNILHLTLVYEMKMWLLTKCALYVSVCVRLFLFTRHLRLWVQSQLYAYDLLVELACIIHELEWKKCLYEYVIWSRQLSERLTIYWKRSWGKPGVYLWSYPLPALESFLKPVYNCLFIFYIVLFILFCPCFSCLFCLYDVDRY